MNQGPSKLGKICSNQGQKCPQPHLNLKHRSQSLEPFCQDHSDLASQLSPLANIYQILRYFVVEISIDAFVLSIGSAACGQESLCHKQRPSEENLISKYFFRIWLNKTLVGPGCVLLYLRGLPLHQARPHLRQLPESLGLPLCQAPRHPETLPEAGVGSARKSVTPLEYLSLFPVWCRNIRDGIARH